MQGFQGTLNLEGLPPEALRNICDILIGAPALSKFIRVHPPNEPDDHGYGGLHTVISLARTSRILHEHAADALWDTIPAFGVLAYTLPRDVWRRRRVGGPGGPLEVALHRRWLENADLIRFNHYAPRVKRILLPAACTHFPPRTRSILFSPTILDAFESRPYGKLLPNLRVLRCSPDLQYYADFYRSFSVLFGPKIQDVSTWCPYQGSTAPKVDEGHWNETLSRMHAMAPNLCTLNLNVNGQLWASSSSSLLSNVVARTSTCLRALQVGHMPINLGALRHIAALPYLVVFAAKLAGDITANDLVLLFRPGMNSFPTLRELRLTHSSDLFLLTLFVTLKKPTIACLEIVALHVLDFPVPFHLVTNFLETIVEHEDVHNFSLISLECQVESQPPDRHVLTENHLRPFFALRQLRWLYLGVRCDFDIDNRTLQKAAAAWPKIKALVLGPSPTKKTSKVTLEGLIPLARGCPHLKLLGLTIDPTLPMEEPVDLNGPYGSLLLHGPTVNVDLSMLPSPAALTPKHFQRKPLSKAQPPLVELKLGRSPLSNPAAVAGFLSCYFPNVKYIRGDWRSASVLEEQEDNGIIYSEEETREIIAEVECRAAWYRVVNKILPEIARTREHERIARGSARVGEATSAST